MFYEIINEFVKIKTGKTIWGMYGEDFYRTIYSFSKKQSIDVYNRSLFLMKYIATTLDVPVDFIISIIGYGGIIEDEQRVNEECKSNG